MNQLFADKTLEAIEFSKMDGPDIVPLIWIHDYHLTLMPSILRQVFFLIEFLPMIASY